MLVKTHFQTLLKKKSELEVRNIRRNKGNKISVPAVKEILSSTNSSAHTETEMIHGSVLHQHINPPHYYIWGKMKEEENGEKQLKKSNQKLSHQPY